MDYFTGMAGTNVYEFPYSGNQTKSTPFFSPHSDMHQFNINSSLDNLIHQSPSSFTVHTTHPISSSFNNNNNNTVVYQVPDNVPLDLVLRQLGVDVNTLEPPFRLGNHYTSSPLSLEVALPPTSSNHRRLVCHEVSDSDHGHHYGHSSHHFDSGYNQHDHSPARIHDMVNNVWERSRDATRNFPQSNSAPNMNSQRPPSTSNMPSPIRSLFGSRSSSPPPMQNSYPPMRNAYPPRQNSPPPMQNPYPPRQNSPPPMQNQYPSMQNSPSPMMAQNRNAVNNVWNQASNASNKKPGFLPSFLNKMTPGRGNVNQPSPQQNQGPMPNYAPGGTAPFGNNTPNSAVANVWNRADNSIMRGSPFPQQSSYSSGSPMNTPWNQMPRGPPQPPGSPVNNVWNQMSRGSNQPSNPSASMGRPQQGGYPQSPMRGPQQGGYPQSPMRGPQQGGYPPSPMGGPQQGGYPQSPMRGPQQGGYPPSPMGGQQQGGYSSAAPASFASLLSRSKM